MKRFFASLVLATALLTAASAQINVVPYPQYVRIYGENGFNAKGASFYLSGLDEASTAWVNEFAKDLGTATGTQPRIYTVPAGQALRYARRPIFFERNIAFADEAYEIVSNSSDVHVTAGTATGFLYAIQTLKQLMPVAIFSGKLAPKDTRWTIPSVRIQDRPRFAYRGLHLDCARHYFSLDEIKKVLDLMVLFKMNRFHWHLTEDQGWRIEIKKYPRLTEIGAWRDGTCIKKDFDSSDGIRYGGYYTQDQMREIVAYAAERGIIVIPEIDLPGHMLAALAAYPELGCTGGPYKVWQRWGISADILCAGNEQVFTFLDDVFTELVDIFPSEYIHIGGDECFPRGEAYPWDSCPKCKARMEELGIAEGPEAKHYLQNYVTARVQEMLAAKGRKVIGWDEILDGELAPGATVMSWRGTAGGIKAAGMGFDAIMTPYTYLYFDYYQSRERDREPFAIGGYLPVEKVYAYEPLDGIPAGAESHILGVQANLWTEYIATPEHLEYMLLPRMCALSEIQWCDRDRKDWDRFNRSLDRLFDVLETLGCTVCHDVRGEIGLSRTPARSQAELEEYLKTANHSW